MTQRLLQLADFVTSHRGLWHPRPFRERPAPWEAAWPAEAAWLRGLAPAAIDALEAGSGPAWPPRLATLAAAARALTLVPACEGDATAGRPVRRVKARKQRQIEAFAAAALPHLRPATPATLVDWCGGKGHLSRALAQPLGCGACVVDLAPALIAEATALGAAAGVSVAGVAADVRVPLALTPPPPAALLSLHACGHLSDHALQHADAGAYDSAVVVPCCHHRLPPGGWRPMSRLLLDHGLALPHTALRLAIADEGPATPRERARRHQEMRWRVALDLLLADQGEPEPYGVIRRRAYRQPFAEFCAALLEARGLALPAGFDPEGHEARAAEETRIIRALALVRGLFRRPIELLCVSDRARWLEERGWQVAVRRFCAPAVTPRNLMILARRVADPDPA